MNTNDIPQGSAIQRTFQATLHILEQVQALKQITDERIGKALLPYLVDCATNLKWAHDVSGLVPVAAGWTYKLKSKPRRGRLKSIGEIHIWLRILSSEADSRSKPLLDPFISIEVGSQAPEDWGNLDDYQCPSEWVTDEQCQQFLEVDTSIPVMAAAKAVEDEEVWWAGVAYKIIDLTASDLEHSYFNVLRQLTQVVRPLHEKLEA